MEQKKPATKSALQEQAERLMDSNHPMTAMDIRNFIANLYMVLDNTSLVIPTSRTDPKYTN